jgi:hypothetical protein
MTGAPHVVRRTVAPRDAAATTVTEINATIAAAFEAYPELDVAEILGLCRPALEDLLRRSLRENTQATIREIRTRTRLTKDE